MAANWKPSTIQNGSGGWAYEYVIKDHLGNGRVWFAPNAAGTATVTRQEVHYDPFGFELEGINGAAGSTSPANAYHYNGKELNPEFGIGWLDYGVRWFEAALGRWWSVDPLAQTSYSVTPFAYVNDNPIAYVDLDGRLWINPYKSLLEDAKRNNEDPDRIKELEGLSTQVDNMLTELKKNDSELYNYIDNLKVQIEGPDGVERDRQISVRVYLSDSDKPELASTSFEFDKNTSSKYKGEEIYTPLPVNPSGGVNLLDADRVKGGGYGFSVVLFDTDSKKLNAKDVSLANEAGDIMYAMEFNHDAKKERNSALYRGAYDSPLPSNIP